MRLRITFSKTGSLRYTGHLDLQTVWERTIRRAGLPLAYTHGFHPGPKIQIASALPLGFLGRRELVDIWLIDVGADLRVGPPVDLPAPAFGGPVVPTNAPGGVLAAGLPAVPAADLPAPAFWGPAPAFWGPAPAFWGLQPAAPPGLTILSVEQVDESAPALQTQVVSAEYEVTLLEPVSISDLDKRLQHLLAATSLPRQRRGKDYNLRPLVEELALTPLFLSPHFRRKWGELEGGLVSVLMRLSARQGATGRPEEVLDVLGIPFDTTRIERTRLILQSGKEI